MTGRPLATRHFVIISLILIAGVAVYANSLGNEFVWDDDVLIKENAFIKNWVYLPRIFVSDMGAGAGATYHYYRPLQIFTYLVDYTLWKFNLAGYHLTNILAHCLAAWALYALMSSLFNNPVLASLTALFFVLHPVQTEAVTYLSGRCDPLAIFFMLVSFLSYVKGARLAVALSYALALLSKENALILPAILLLYHFTFKRKIAIKAFMPVAAISLAYLFLRITLLKSFMPDAPEASGVLERAPGFFVAVTNYLRLILMPFGLHMEYGRKIFSITHPNAISGMIITASLLVWAIRNRHKTPLVFFSVSWFFISLAPASNIYPPLAFYMAEHYLYLPSVGFFLILAAGIVYLYKVNKATAMILGLGLLFAYSALTINQNAYWKNPQTIFEKTLEYAPDSGRVNCDLGNVYNNQGRYREAIALIKKAIALNPLDEKAYNNLGNSYYALGEIERAIPLYGKALELDPRDAKTYNNLANSYSAIGATDKAIANLRKAMEVNPYLAASYYNLGVVYMNRGDSREALSQFKKALGLDPRLAEAYVNMAVIYAKTGKDEEAIGALKKAIAIRPDYEKARGNLEALYSRERQ